jgi:glutamate/tyrosine decarboxylase-like PLP-dependent enzyme
VLSACLGIGAKDINTVPADNLGRMDTAALEQIMRRSADAPTIVRPTIVSLQAGDLNTGIFDPFPEACRIAHAHGAWVHVDGAFGLWAATSDKYRHLLDGAAQADSWATDGHKWLNLPFDCGLVFVADPSAHRAAFAQDTSYAVPAEAVRNQKDWNPEWSRRGRGFAAYAAIRALGRSRIADIVDRCCAHATRLTESIGGLTGAEIVARSIVNQGLVRFLSPDGDHDHQTDATISRIQAEGVAWFGGATWRGMRVMRISVCNWMTTEHDVDAAIASVRAAMGATSG